MAKWTEWNFNTIFERVSFTGLKAVGLMLEGAAARLAPRDTGRLAGSITHSIKGFVSPVRTPAQAEDAVTVNGEKDSVWVGTNVGYAPHIEYGTQYTPAQSYLREAMDYNKEKAADLYARELKRVLHGS